MQRDTYVVYSVCIQGMHAQLIIKRVTMQFINKYSRNNITVEVLPRWAWQKKQLPLSKKTTDPEDSVLYLFDEGGIIGRVDKTAYVTRDESHELGTSKHSALHDTSEPEWLRLLVSRYESVIENLWGKLHTATETVSGTNAKRLTEEAVSLKAAVQAEKLKAKGSLRLCCEQMLWEEDPLQRKDTEITELRKQFSFPETPPGSMGDKGMSPTKSTASSHKHVETIHPILSVQRRKAPPVKALLERK